MWEYDQTQWQRRNQQGAGKWHIFQEPKAKVTHQAPIPDIEN